MSYWISVDERTPPCDMPVLVSSNGCTHEIVMMIDYGDDRGEWFKPYFFNFDEYKGFKIACKPTHWMPLPPPPEADK